MDMLSYPIGGLYCGLWKRDVLQNNSVIFPRKSRYEDNYYGSLITCYLTKAAFVPKICYFYRVNPLSTVHARNESWHLDRIRIEHDLLAEVKKRGFFDRYYSAWEYIYTFRYAFNTSMKLLSAYDHPPEEIIRKVWRDLDREFPEWRKNRYYQTNVSWNMKARYFAVSHFPGASIRFFPFLRKCKRMLKGNPKI